MTEDRSPSVTPRPSWLPREATGESLERVDPWEVKDVTNWDAVGPESRGKRSKCWVADPDGVRWLRKEPWGSRPFEPAVEILALRLAHAVLLPTPQCYPCVWTTPDGERRGIVVRSFADAVTESQDSEVVPGRQLQEGAVILVRSDPTYRTALHQLHSISRVKKALEELEAQHPAAELLLPFLQLMAFDAWIGNTDRHQHNWAVLWQDVHPSLAPVYDPAACLGVELTDNHPLLDTGRRTPERIARYIRGAPSGFGDGQTMIPLTQVVADLRSWSHWSEYVQGWLATFQAAVDTTVVGFLTTLPQSWLPSVRQELAVLLLTERLRWLKTQV